MTALAKSAIPGRRLPADVTAWPFDAHGLPLMVEPDRAALRDDPAAARAWFAEHRETLEALATEHGCVMLRGFAIPDTADFNALIDVYQTDPEGYAGGLTPRKNISGKVFEASRVPADQKIILHQEMAYLPNYPRLIAFYCRVPSETQGATTIGDVRRFTAAMPAALRDSVRERGVLYRRNYRAPSHVDDPLLALFRREWTDVLQVETREEAEAACHRIGCEAVWEDDGSLSMLYRAPGFVTHPTTGEDVWFAQVMSMHFNRTRLDNLYDKLATAFPAGRPRPIEILYGDGGDIPEALVEPVYALLDELSVNVPYRAGDLMLLDNFHCAHGREPYTGHRDVQVALAF